MNVDIPSPAQIASEIPLLIGSSDWDSSSDAFQTRGYIENDDYFFTIAVNNDDELHVRDAGDDQTTEFPEAPYTPLPYLARLVAHAIGVLQGRPGIEGIPNPYHVAVASLTYLGDQCGARPGPMAGTALIVNQDATNFLIEALQGCLRITCADNGRHALLPPSDVDTAARALADQIGALF